MKEKTFKPEIELRSTELEDLLGRAPSNIVKWGISIFFGILLIIVMFCCFFKYPQIVTASITITTENPAMWVIAKSSGKLDSILVSNNDSVYPNQILAAISNPCRLKDALILKKYLHSLRHFMTDFDPDSISYYNEALELGELQSDYLQLSKILSEYHFFCKEKYHELILKNTAKEMDEQKSYLKNLRYQKHLLTKNEKIAKYKFERDTLLYNKKIIQITDLENSQKQVINGQLESSRIDLTINITSINLIQLSNKLLENKTDFNSKKLAYKNAILTLFNQLCAKLSIWENQYVLKSSVNGIVSFSNVWSNNQQVTTGEKVFAILSDTPGKIVGKCKIPITGYAKIIKQQPVIIKLDSYPFLEFGTINGIISSISKLPYETISKDKQMMYVMAEIDLDYPLISSYKKRIDFSGELVGNAEITIEDLTLIQHFINPLKYLWNKSKINK